MGSPCSVIFCGVRLGCVRGYMKHCVNQVGRLVSGRCRRLPDVESYPMLRRQICGKPLGDSAPAAELSQRSALALRPLSCPQEFHGGRDHVGQGQRHGGLSPPPGVRCRGRERFPAVPRSPFRRSENNATLLLAWKCATAPLFIIQDRPENAGRIKVWVAVPVDRTLHA